MVWFFVRWFWKASCMRSSSIERYCLCRVGGCVARVGTPVSKVFARKVIGTNGIAFRGRDGAREPRGDGSLLCFFVSMMRTWCCLTKGESIGKCDDNLRNSSLVKEWRIGLKAWNGFLFDKCMVVSCRTKRCRGTNGLLVRTNGFARRWIDGCVQTSLVLFLCMLLAKGGFMLAQMHVFAMLGYWVPRIHRSTSQEPSVTLEKAGGTLDTSSLTKVWAVYAGSNPQ